MADITKVQNATGEAIQSAGQAPTTPVAEPLLTSKVETVEACQCAPLPSPGPLDIYYPINNNNIESMFREQQVENRITQLEQELTMLDTELRLNGHTLKVVGATVLSMVAVGMVTLSTVSMVANIVSAFRK
jgi:hypothetical protein